MHHLMGASDIAKLLDVTRQGVSHIVKTNDTFPPPTAVISGVRIWEREAVEAWARRERRVK
jgi:hypothetical protein